MDGWMNPPAGAPRCRKCGKAVEETCWFCDCCSACCTDRAGHQKRPYFWMGDSPPEIRLGPEGEVSVLFSGRRLLELLGDLYSSERVAAIREKAIENARAEGRTHIADRSIHLAAAECIQEDGARLFGSALEDEPG